MFLHIHSKSARVQPSRALSWQARRGYANAERLGQDVSMLAVAHGATCLGRDEQAATLFDRAGLGADAIAVVRFRASGMTSTVAIPTYRTWNRYTSRRLAVDISEAAFAVGRLVVVASPHDVTLQPRLGNAGRICRSMLPPAAGDAEAVRARIRIAGGEASLRSCQAALGPPLSLARIFGLMVGGQLAIDLETPLGDDSTVRVRPDGWIFDWGMFGWQAIRGR